MKKLISGSILILVIILGGCQKKSEDLLTYESSDLVSSNYDRGNYLNVQIDDFFAKDLAVVPMDRNNEPASSSSARDDASENEVNSDNDTNKDNQESDLSSDFGAALLINTTNDNVLFSENVYNRLYPASLTKLMTALVVLKHAELNDIVTISKNAANIDMPGAKLCGFQEGDEITMDALLHSLLIYSGNDAGIAIADHVAGSEEAFAKMMNEEAKKIGAIHSHFVNPHGLHDDDHYTTAYDLYLIFHELLKNDTFRSIISMDSYEAVYKDRDGNEKTKTFKTTNKYLDGSVEAVDNIKIIGGKTGTTDKAGNCLILLSEDNKNNDYISLILKADSSESLYSEMSDLLSMAAGD